MNAWLLALLSVTAVSAVSLAGLLTLAVDEARIRRIAMVFVAFAVGALLGDAFIHLLPEAFSAGSRTLQPSLLVLAGMMAFFSAEKLLRHRHGVGHVHDYLHAPARPLAAVSILGDTIHNFIDGALIAASYLAGPALGASTTAAVVLHELPQELGDFGILLHSGYSVRKAVLVNLASASAALVGALVTLAAGAVWTDAVVAIMIPFTAGGFVYLAAADLIPELQHDHSLGGFAKQAGLIALGVAVMALVTLVD
jgi:zinc and cadmium transporter